MNIAKFLLLGSTAGLIAIAGARAADLPVKANAVEYLRGCSLYGPGFYYIPGTDICLSVGSYIRWQERYNSGANIALGPFAGTGGRNTRLDSSDWIMRTRGVAAFDTRQQTQFGVLRTYLALGFQQDSTAAPTTSPPVFINRGFIQLAGFTFGKATSFFDFANATLIAYDPGMVHAALSSDAGQMVAAYTAMIGRSTSATISAEQSERAATVFASPGSGSYSLGINPTANNLSQLSAPGFNTGITGIPDFVANVRWDGTWGGFQIASVLHDVSAGYYGATETSGHPSNKWGWAISPGLRLNVPMFGPGDWFQAGYVYSQGAVRWAGGVNPTTLPYLRFNGDSVGWGFWEDGVYATGGSIELTTAWSFMASYEHFWTPALKTSIYGSYVKVTHNANATASICGTGTAGTIPFAPTCNPDWGAWNVGSRTQWNITNGLYLGLDVVRLNLNTATANNLGLVALSAQGAKPAATYRVSDQSAWVVSFRVQRDILGDAPDRTPRSRSYQ
jgi:porin-like protein